MHSCFTDSENTDVKNDYRTNEDTAHNNVNFDY
jgi:hypothetical protein